MPEAGPTIAFRGRWRRPKTRHDPAAAAFEQQWRDAPKANVAVAGITKAA